MSAIANGLLGRTLFGIDGQKIGRITAIYVNAATGTSKWVAVRTHGLIGAKVVFAPVALVVREGEQAVVTFDKQHVRHAPRARSEGSLSPPRATGCTGITASTRTQLR